MRAALAGFEFLRSRVAAPSPVLRTARRVCVRAAGPSHACTPTPVEYVLVSPGSHVHAHTSFLWGWRKSYDKQSRVHFEARRRVGYTGKHEK